MSTLREHIAFIRDAERVKGKGTPWYDAQACTMVNAHLDEIERAVAGVQRAIDHIDCRSELYTSDGDVLFGVRAILAAALPETQEQNP